MTFIIYANLHSRCVKRAYVNDDINGTPKLTFELKRMITTILLLFAIKMVVDIIFNTYR